MKFTIGKGVTLSYCSITFPVVEHSPCYSFVLAALSSKLDFLFLFFLTRGSSFTIVFMKLSKNKRETKLVIKHKVPFCDAGICRSMWHEHCISGSGFGSVSCWSCLVPFFYPEILLSTSHKRPLSWAFLLFLTSCFSSSENSSLCYTKAITPLKAFCSLLHSVLYSLPTLGSAGNYAKGSDNGETTIWRHHSDKNCTAEDVYVVSASHSSWVFREP